MPNKKGMSLDSFSLTEADGGENLTVAKVGVGATPNFLISVDNINKF